MEVGEEVLDLVIPYIHHTVDRNSLSLVSRKFYEIDGITRKCVTVHTLYYPNPTSLTKRFPFIESLTLEGPPSGLHVKCYYDIPITPWIEHLALEFRCLKELHIRLLVVNDEDLETLARTRGKDLWSLKINKCEGFSTDGLRHVSKYCNQLRTFSLRKCYNLDVKDGIWLHQFALNSTVLERFHARNTYIPNAGDITLLANKCCNSLISLKFGKCYLSKVGDAFRYAVRLEQFGSVYIFDEETELVGFQFPPNIHSFSNMEELPVSLYSSVLPLLNQIRKLKLVFLDLDECLLYKRCPNLEVLYTKDECGDRGLQVIGMFCKKLRKLTCTDVTHVGLIALAKGCTNLEYLGIYIKNISNEALECVGTHLKNLRDFRIRLSQDNSITILPLDYGVRAMLVGCSKLERLDIYIRHGGLTTVGLEYIGMYGVNLRSLGLEWVGNSNDGLVKISKGCQKLRTLKLIGCPFSEQVIASFVFNIPSLRYVWGYNRSDRTDLALARPEFNFETSEGSSDEV